MPRLALLALAMFFMGLACSANATLAEQTILTSVKQESLSATVVRAKTSWRWLDCGSSTDVVRIESIEVSPDPPEKGKDLSIEVTGNAGEVVEDGAFADVTVKIGPLRVLQKRYDLCEEARNANASIQCPIDEGRHIVNQTVTLPKEIPNALYRINVRGYTMNDEDMVCIDLDVDFRNRPFPDVE
ncbi:hypothetical protein PUNSTDRAFT_116237 [Punctularia strigosozonata HHB-11173 SS5]|uniref:Phosphatidylglycerol/phosphatidylinositol transfer protein n=1 Tax=Punctularia strigosozonata (strain HHB-11173) TaxID=741275 RepID=R7S3H2_PUNST|nr:uncharacterized protein PUNSTDRAFT_116237 [Punctularia strigosozonata HHB-11173 SS5]EIN04960.1 hypothetical protein PUNSTDRAFT_116237 [Punctularia strigosozonata HHB-11173 SS5]